MSRLFIFPLCLWFFLSFSSASFAQTAKKLVPDKQRALKWKPEKGSYYFSHALTYEYQDKKRRTKGEFKVYLDPATGTMCFQKQDSYGNSGSFDFIIASKDGKYMYATTDGAKKTRKVEIVEGVTPDAETKAQQAEEFSTYCIPTGSKRPDILGEATEYDLTYATSETKDKLWITTVPFNVYPLYGFDLVEEAVTLPVSVDYSHLLGQNQLLTELSSVDTYLRLKSAELSPLAISTAGYVLQKPE